MEVEEEKEVVEVCVCACVDMWMCECVQIYGCIKLGLKMRGEMIDPNEREGWGISMEEGDK